jgi:hypothetical protein
VNRRLALLLGVLVAGGATVVLLPRVLQKPVRATRVFDRRCRGGCTDTALLRVLPGGVSPSLIAAGTLSGSKGQTITTTRASNKTCTRADGTVTYLSSNVPCVESQGLLVEGASTNLALRSEDLIAAAWSASGTATATADQAVSPDGNTTADRLQINATSGGAFNYRSQTVTLPASSVTVSTWIKGVSGSGNLYLFGTPDAVSYGRVNCLYVSTAWTRCTGSFTGTAAGWFMGIGTDLRDASQSATVANDVYVWGYQVEAQPFATSYIPTTGTSASRAADVVSVANPFKTADTVFGAAYTATPEGTWVTGTQRLLLIAGGGFASNNTVNWWVDAFNRPAMDIVDSAAGDLFMNGTALTGAVTHRFVVVSPTTTTVTYSLDGVTQAPTVSGTRAAINPQGPSMYFGSDSAGGKPFYGWLSDVCVANAAGACR